MLLGIYQRADRLRRVSFDLDIDAPGLALRIGVDPNGKKGQCTGKLPYALSRVPRD